MTTFYDVPADALIEAAAEEFDIEAPEWATYAKSGVSRELPPETENFWQRRAASLLRRIAIDGPVGIERLRTHYGSSKQGSTRYRVRPDMKAKASGNIIRTICQQLESEGLVETAEGEGRRITGAGRSFLDETASDVLEELDRPELERYA